MVLLHLLHSLRNIEQIFCLHSNSAHINSNHTHTHSLDLSVIYLCLCSFCLFSFQACEFQAVRRRRASLGCPALLHPLPAPLLALPVVTLGCMPTWQLQRTTGEERYGGVNWMWDWTIFARSPQKCHRKSSVLKYMFHALKAEKALPHHWLFVQITVTDKKSCWEVPHLTSKAKLLIYIFYSNYLSNLELFHVRNMDNF